MKRRIYRGWMDGQAAIVSVRDTYNGVPALTRILDPGPSLKVRNHSPTGFAWGYNGSGPAQLALAVLLDWGGEGLVEVAEGYYQQFKDAFVVKWPQDGEWEITEDEIDRWIAERIAEVTPSTPECEIRVTVRVRGKATPEALALAVVDTLKASCVDEASDVFTCDVRLEKYSVCE